MRSQIYSSVDVNVTDVKKISLLSVHSRFINTATKSAVNNKYALNKFVNLYTVFILPWMERLKTMNLVIF